MMIIVFGPSLPSTTSCALKVKLRKRWSSLTAYPWLPILRMEEPKLYAEDESEEEVVEGTCSKCIEWIRDGKLPIDDIVFDECPPILKEIS